MTLTEFLLARIAEDEAAAHGGLGESAYSHYADTAAGEVIAMGWGEGVADEGMKHFDRWLPKRVLAECEAKRRIVNEHQPAFQHDDEARHGYSRKCITCGQVVPRRHPCATLRALALPYADHPDFDPAWRM